MEDKSMKGSENGRGPGDALDRIAELEQALALQKRMEASLRESEEKYRFHFQLANDVMFSYNYQLKVLSVSPNVERILGYQPEEFIGKSLYEAGVLDESCVSLAVTNALKVLSGQAVNGSLYEFIARDGSRKFGEVSGVPVIRDGKVAEVVTVARDITERLAMERSLRQSEERYRTTLEGLPDAVGIVTAADCRFLYVNDGFSRLTGRTREEALGSTPRELGLAESEEDLEHLLVLVRESLPVESLEFRCRAMEREVLDTLVAARPVEYDGQACMVVVMTDVTEVKRIEEEKNLIEIQSQKFESMGTLARGIAHDFNNILTTIIGYTRMTMKDILSRVTPENDFTAVRSHLEEVRRSALRARDLVEQILAFSRHAEKAHVALDLGAAVGGALKDLRYSVPPAVELHQETAVPGFIMGDPGQVRQVVVNLCTNAFHAMKDGRGRLDVVVARVQADEGVAAELGLSRGPHLKLTIRDTGAGMGRATLSRIFDPYFTTKGKEHGTGLGLSVVHGIVKSHGGCILCASEPGKGTTFEVWFPEAAGGLAMTYEARMPLPRAGSPANISGAAVPPGDARDPLARKG